MTGHSPTEPDAMPAAGRRDDGSLSAIRRLRRVAELVADRDDVAAAWFVTRVAEYEGSARVGFTLDEILGLTPPAGCRAWFTIEKLHHRDHWLRLAAARHFPGRSDTEQGNQIAVQLARYQAGPEWQKVKNFAAPPAHYRETLRECLFHVLKAGRAPSARTIRAVLAVREPPAIC